MKEKYPEYWKYHLDYRYNTGKAPTTAQFARYFGFSRERGRQILNEMIENGYPIIKHGKGRARYDAVMCKQWMDVSYKI